MLLACPASRFLTGAGCCSAGALGVLPTEERTSAGPWLQGEQFTRYPTKAPAPGYLLPASGDATLEDASLF